MIFSRKDLERIYFYVKGQFREGRRWMSIEQGPVFKRQEHFQFFHSKKEALAFVKANTSLLKIYMVRKIKPFETLAGRILSGKFIPLIIDTNNYVLLLNNQIMNLKNLEFHKDTLKYLGFPESMYEKLESNLQAGVSDFNLNIQMPHFNGMTDYTLHYNKGEADIYFLNTIRGSIAGEININHSVIKNGAEEIDTKELEARIKAYPPVFPPTSDEVKRAENQSETQAYYLHMMDDLKNISASEVGKDIADRIAARHLSGDDFRDNPKAWESAQKIKDEARISQTFYYNKGRGLTAKEINNLLEGRAVCKELKNKEGEKYTAWMQLDRSQKENGQFRVIKYNNGYGFDLERELDRSPFKELSAPSLRAEIAKGLKKGNLVPVTAQTEEGSRRQLISANPGDRKFNRYYTNGKPIEEVSLSQQHSQSKKNAQKQSAERGEGDEPPGKRRGRKVAH